MGRLIVSDDHSCTTRCTPGRHTQRPPHGSRSACGLFGLRCFHFFWIPLTIRPYEEKSRDSFLCRTRLRLDSGRTSGKCYEIVLASSSAYHQRGPSEVDFKKALSETQSWLQERHILQNAQSLRKVGVDAAEKERR